MSKNIDSGSFEQLMAEADEQGIVQLSGFVGSQNAVGKAGETTRSVKGGHIRKK